MLGGMALNTASRAKLIDMVKKKNEGLGGYCIKQSRHSDSSQFSCAPQ